MSMVENPYPLGGDFAEAWGEGAAAERERIVKLLRDHAESFAGSPYKLNAAAYRMAADHIEGTRFDADERSAPSPSPPEPAPDVDAIIERLRERRTFINPGRPPLVPLTDAVAAVREAAAPSPPEPQTGSIRSAPPSPHGRAGAFKSSPPSLADIDTGEGWYET